MNIAVRIRGGDTALEEAFLSEAERAGLVELKGHRSVGGLRVSLYNAMSVEGTEVLAHFMDTFKQKHS